MSIQPLTDSLHQLRKQFHSNLSRRRGLLVSEKDLVKVSDFDDLALQKHLERLTAYRRPFFRLKKGFKSAYRLFKRRA